jgi:hypothetical protein
LAKTAGNGTRHRAADLRPGNCTILWLLERFHNLK